MMRIYVITRNCYVELQAEKSVMECVKKNSSLGPWRIMGIAKQADVVTSAVEQGVTE